MFRIAVWSLVGALALSAALFVVWILTLPASSPGVAPPVAREEREATLAALKPPRRARPLIAVVGLNDSTEVTDYLMPYGVLRRADVADVVALAMARGPVKLFPALTVEAQATVAEFDARHPDGADYVIVPAMSRDDDPAVLAWLKSQAAKGAIVVGVCAGAKVVAAAGLLDGKRATTHWYYLDQLRKRTPTLRYVADRRVVVDGRVATTTGVTASMPMALMLVEAIAGREKADAVAREVGLARYDVRHDSGAFAFTRAFATTALGNVLAFWNRERIGIALEPGVDEIALALAADAWSRTWRSHAETYAAAGPVTTRGGLRIAPDHVAVAMAVDHALPPIDDRPAMQILDRALGAIETRYGARTADFVAMQLEYPRPPRNLAR